MELTLEQSEKIKKGFIQEIGVKEFAVLLTIKAHMDIQGTCFPSQETISNLVGMSVKSVQRATKTLEEQGLIAKTLKKKGKKTVTHYSIGQTELDEPTHKYNNSRDFIKEFCRLYEEQYSVQYNPSWARDGAMVKNKLLSTYTDEQLDAILQIVFRDYSKKWANNRFPRPTIGAICTFLPNQVLPIWQKEQDKIKKIEEAEQEDLTKYFTQQNDF